jgi:hypothetical protein
LPGETGARRARRDLSEFSVDLELGTAMVSEAGCSLEGSKKPFQNIECRFPGKVLTGAFLRIRTLALAL